MSMQQYLSCISLSLLHNIYLDDTIFVTYFIEYRQIHSFDSPIQILHNRVKSSVYYLFYSATATTTSVFVELF